MVVSEARPHPNPFLRGEGTPNVTSCLASLSPVGEGQEEVEKLLHHPVFRYHRMLLQRAEDRQGKAIRGIIGLWNFREL